MIKTTRVALIKGLDDSRQFSLSRHGLVRLCFIRSKVYFPSGELLMRADVVGIAHRCTSDALRCALMRVMRLPNPAGKLR